MSYEAPIEEKIETVCRTCVFGAYEDMDDPKLQTGCKAGMIDIYRKQGVRFKEYVDDYDQKFYGVLDRLCPYFRTREWVNKQPEEEDLLLIARDEMTLMMEVIIYIPEQEDSPFVNIGLTLDSLARNKIKPTKIIFCDHHNIRPATFRKWITGRCAKMGWRAEHIREHDADFYRCIDICMKKATARYIGVFTSGYWVPEDYISSIDSALHDRFERFLYLEPVDQYHNGMTIQCVINKHMRGNAESPLIRKLRKKTLEQECPHLIKKVTEIVPSMLEKSQQSASSSLVTTMPNI